MIGQAQASSLGKNPCPYHTPESLQGEAGRGAPHFCAILAENAERGLTGRKHQANPNQGTFYQVSDQQDCLRCTMETTQWEGAEGGSRGQAWDQVEILSPKLLLWLFYHKDLGRSAGEGRPLPV